MLQVRKAVDRGEGVQPGEWGEYKARLKQAAADAETFEEALQRAQAYHDVIAFG